MDVTVFSITIRLRLLLAALCFSVSVQPALADSNEFLGFEPFKSMIAAHGEFREYFDSCATGKNRHSHCLSVTARGDLKIADIYKIKDRVIMQLTPLQYRCRQARCLYPYLTRVSMSFPAKQFNRIFSASTMGIQLPTVVRFVEDTTRSREDFACTATSRRGGQYAFECTRTERYRKLLIHFMLEHLYQ